MDSDLVKSGEKSSGSRYRYGKAMEMEDHKKRQGGMNRSRKGSEPDG